MAPTIAATAHSGWQRLVPLLEAAGLQDPARAEATHEKIEARLRKADAPTALLFTTRPERLLAQAIEQDEDPAARLDAWIDSARTLLQAYRCNRRNAVIVDVDEAIAAPETFIDICARRFSLAVPKTIPAPAQAEKGEASQDPVHALIATQWVAASSNAVPLLEELDASRTPLTESGIPQAADVASAWQAYREVCARAANESRLQELQEENELLLLQLHQVQEELESYYLEARDKEQERARLADKLEQSEKKRQEQTREVERLSKEVDRLRQDRDRVNGILKNMKASRSWRVTAPLRALTGKKRGSSAGSNPAH